MKIASIVFLIGVSLLLYSLTLEPYSDPELFQKQYMALDHTQSNEFYTLREKMVTTKYLLQDLGISIILLLLISVFFLKLGKGKILTPKKPFIISLAVALPFLTTAGSIFDLFQGLFRGEFPHWADSIAIPLSGVPIIFIILFIWSMCHLLFITSGDVPLTKTKIEPLPILSAITFKLNPWLIVVSFLTLILTCITILYGQYWFAVSGIFWLYFYLSLGAIRLNTKCT